MTRFDSFYGLGHRRKIFSSAGSDFEEAVHFELSLKVILVFAFLDVSDLPYLAVLVLSNKLAVNTLLKSRLYFQLIIRAVLS